MSAAGFNWVLVTGSGCGFGITSRFGFAVAAGTSVTGAGFGAATRAACLFDANGFGFAPNKENQYQKIIQIGNVIIEDHVEIGSNTLIGRRGTFLIQLFASVSSRVML